MDLALYTIKYTIMSHLTPVHIVCGAQIVGSTYFSDH